MPGWASCSAWKNRRRSVLELAGLAFDRVLGRDRLAALHLNDSKTKRGSRVDRHAHIGEGEIGLEAFRFLMNEPRFRKIPKVLETPKGKDLAEDVTNLATLRALEPLLSAQPRTRRRA